jgi:glycosyltransferase involved in cell wall biosynthesis
MIKTSLIITTYNWKEALAAVLDSVKIQTTLPDEVIIADDGSTADTRLLIEQLQPTFPVPLIHSWQEDQGFRLSKNRNIAIAKSTGDYIIMIDGDIVLSPTFVESHLNSAKKGWFVQGGRVLTNQECSSKIMNLRLIPTIFSKGIRNRKNCISSPFLSKIFSYERNNANSTRGCNMAFWREDVIKSNGFNEDFVGWGREDSEFTYRLLHLGKKRLYLKFSGIGYHLYHLENTRQQLAANQKILNDTINLKRTRCKNGIDQYLLS